MKYIVSLSLGPVQEFIAAARRTRDLRMGSWLLSELSKSVALRIREDDGELIFPFSKQLKGDLQPGSKYAASNKLLAIIEAADEKALREYTGELKKTAVKRLSDVRDDALTEARRAAGPNGIDKDRIEAQVQEYIEFYAAWAPYQEGEYSACRDAAERWAAARKTLRDFRPHQGAELPKSSLDGIRETVIRKDGLRATQYHVKANEQLDGIGLIKRFGGRKPNFDSTIDVAAVPYVARLKRIKSAELEEYESWLEDHKHDVPFSHGYLYRHESRSPLELGEPYATKLDTLLKELRFPEPKPPYYAFFLGDGDSMGATISNIGELRDHQAFSGRLSEFAADVEEAARRPGWNVVFAGGDDVMALLPLHEALGAALTFRAKKKKAMHGPTPTFSAGMVIAHALDPLSEVRSMAKAAERHAKQMDGKNALAIVASPRSGAPVELCDHWERIEGDLSKAVELYIDREISQGFAHALRDLLDSTGRRGFTHLDETLFPLARALANKKDARQPFLDWLDAAQQRAGDGPRKELERLCSLLLVARPIARARREAEA